MKLNNHYIPKTYLKQWGNGGKVFQYCLIVSNDKVPLWKATSITNTSSINSLYVYYDNGILNDEMEDFFSEKFEMNYNLFLSKINLKLPLNNQDLDYIARFVACQQIRTVNGYKNIQKIVNNKLPKILDEIVLKMEEELKKSGTLSIKQSNERDKFIPLNVNINTLDGDNSILEIQSCIGKSYWIYAMKFLLESTYKVLNNISWCIYDAPENFSWVTTDDPVIFLNYYGPNNYDFKGGWKVQNTNVIFPLTPKKLLFAQIGRNFYTYDTASIEFAEEMQKYIIEHAFSSIYANEIKSDVCETRERIVSKEAFIEFYNSRKEFHENYEKYEVPYLKKYTKD